MYKVSGMIDDIVRHAAIGYYLGQDIPIKVDDCAERKTSFFSPDEWMIYIHRQQFDQVKKEFDTPEDAEIAGRSTLYHEVSHAILSPATMIPNEIINIFEDERIETLLGPIFMNVDFWRQRFWINGIEPGDPLEEENQIQKFYNLVRFHSGPKEFLNRVVNIIQRYQFDRNEERLYTIREYIEDVLKLFEDYCGPLPKDMPDPGVSYAGDGSCDCPVHGTGRDAAERAKEDAKDPETGAPSLLDGSDKKEEGAGTSEDDSDAAPGRGAAAAEAAAKTIKKAKKIVDGVLDDIDDSKFMPAIELLLSSRKRRGEHGGSAGYSGKLNVRQFARPDHQYKFWSKPYGNSQNQYEDIHFILWVDESGSFNASAPILNGMIRCLNKCTRKYPFFSFDLITLTTDFVERTKGHEWIHPSGGNDIPERGYKIYTKHRKPRAMNYDIVVFDGDAVSDGRGHGKNMGIWNHPNAIIVSDTDNKTLIERYAPQAKSKILSSGYAEEFIDTIISMLNQLVK